MIFDIEMEKLNNDIKLEKQISIKRDVIDENSLDIVPILLTEDFLLAHYVYDFLVDGYKAIAMKGITRIRRDDIEEYHSSILRKEGIIHKENNIARDEIKNWETFFRFLKNEKLIVDISLEKPENDSFFVGMITKVGKDSLKILEINPLGRWKEESKKICYSDITLVSFGNNYSKMMLKYSEKMKR